MSRYIAISAIGLWLISYIFGVGVLISEARSRRVAYDDLFEAGSRLWAIRDRESTTCLGFIESNFTADEKPQLSINGSITIPVYGMPATIAMNFHSSFTSYYKLQDLRAEISAGGLSLRATSDPADSAKINLVVNSPSKFQTISLRRPEPIYLVERQTGQFSVKFPRSINALLDAQFKEAAPANSLSRFSLAPLLESDRSQCAESERTWSSLNDTPSGILDLGRIFDLLQIDPNSPNVAALTHQDT